MFKKENDLWRAVNPVIKAGVSAFDGVKVKRAFQPATQADGKDPRVVLHRVVSRRYGFQGSKTVEREGKLSTVETWFKEDTFQANALVDRTADDEGFTAKDVLEGLGGYLQGAGVTALGKLGIGILRIQDVTETPYEDSRNTFRMSVSLKFTLTYKQTTEREVPKVERVESGLFRI